MASGAAAVAYREVEAAEEIDRAANDEAAEGEVAAEQSPALTLVNLIEQDNIAPLLAETQLTEIGQRAIEDYRIDKRSRLVWEERTRDATALAMMVAEKKDYPFVSASNVKYPLISKAALQYNASAYPELVKGDRVAKCKTNGKDAQGLKAARADRVSEHLSWQLLTEMPEWEPDTDKLTVILPIVGSVFRKTYFDPSLNRKCSRLVQAQRFVINYWARSIEDAPRYTEELPLYPRDIMERIRDGRFAAFEYGQASAIPEDQRKKNDGGETADQGDEDAPHLFLEQYRLIDLDNDGYPEPYIVTLHVDTEQVCRIVANFTLDTVRMTDDGAKVASIRPQTFYQHYQFMPSPDGGFYGMGFGWLLKDTNEAINSTLNILFDSGHLNNIQGGFIAAGSGIREKEITISRGKFKVINTGGLPLTQAIVPFQYPAPSDALFKLLGLMMEYGNDLASIKDILTGDTGGKVMQPTTVLALIEQGMKVFNATFKRTYRAMGGELKIHARLNVEHLTAEDYNAFFDDDQQQFDPQADYEAATKDIVPVADPNVATKMQALTQAQLLYETGNGDPLINQIELRKRFYSAAQVPDVDALLVPPPEPDPAETAFMQAMKELSLQELVEKINESQTKQLKNVADAEAAEAGPQLALYDAFLKYLTGEQNAAAAPQGGPGGMGGMEGPAPDAMVPPAPQGNGAGPALGPAGGPVQPGAGAIGNVGVPPS